MSTGGINVDLADLSATEALDGSYDTNKNYRSQSGMLGSSLEHMIPEQMFNSVSTNPVQGVSTMKALQLANTQGQKIYTINQANVANILPNLTHSSATMSDISCHLQELMLLTDI